MFLASSGECSVSANCSMWECQNPLTSVGIIISLSSALMGDNTLIYTLKRQPQVEHDVENQFKTQTAAKLKAHEEALLKML